jgi:hypothetical protein
MLPPLLTRRLALLLATAVLLLAYTLALSSSLRHKTPTYDEQGFLVRGVGYLRGENHHMRVGHPLGLNALNSFLIAADPTIALPTEHPSWAETSFHRPGELFMWEIGNDVSRIMLLSRLPSIWLGLLLLAVVGRWAYGLTQRREAGLLALALLALDPNILAHTRLTTTDLGLATGVTFAAYTLWRYLKRPSWTNILLFAAALAFMLNTKFTAGLFVPLLGLILLGFWLHTWRSRQTNYQLSTINYQLLTFPLATFLFLWASYGFQIGTLPQELPTFAQLGGLTLPLSHYLEQLLDIGGRLQVSTPAFLLGQYSDSGWWYYFPVAFLLKTPLPILIALLLSFLYWLYRIIFLPSSFSLLPFGKLRAGSSAFALLPLGYAAFALTTDINLGYRHLLPILPFTALFIAVTLAGSRGIPTSSPGSAVRSRGYFIILPDLVVGWLLLNSLFIYPHFLAFFNGLAGGPDNGWRYLVDSNIDWGQDLAGLQPWLAANEVDEVWLSYFGQGRPDYYGINYRGLDSWPPRFTHPEIRPFFPHDPAPGIYAISATTLQGVHFADHDQYAYFREREPLAKIGYSIFLYEVEPYGRPAELALAGVQVDELTAVDYALLETNQVQLRWFDPGQSWLLLGGASRWLALGENTAVAPHWQPLLDQHYDLAAIGPGYRLYRQVGEPVSVVSLHDHFAYSSQYAVTNSEYGLFTDPGSVGEMGLWGVVTAVEDGTLDLLTVWRVEEWARLGGNGRFVPVNIFIHALDPAAPDSPPLSQWDGMGVRGDGWQPGDWLLHSHSLPLPDLADFDLWLGLYDPDTGQRWRLPDGTDRLYLDENSG